MSDIVPQVEVARVESLAPPRGPQRRLRNQPPPRFEQPSAADTPPLRVAPTPKPMRVVYVGAADLGLGPFGTSSLADPPLVAPERHPRAKLAWGRER